MPKNPEELLALKSYCRRVYMKTLDLCNAYKKQHQISGSWCLCGPPLIEPDLFFISYQGRGADQKFHNTWPRQQLYFNSQYQLGKKLTSIFTNASSGEMLRLSTGTALVFFQCSSEDHWKTMPYDVRYELERFSSTHALSFIEKMRPKLVIAIGSPAFKALVKSPTRVVKLYRNKIVQEGRFAHSHVLGIAHLTGCRLKSDERDVISLNIKQAIWSLKKA